MFLVSYCFFHGCLNFLETKLTVFIGKTYHFTSSKSLPSCSFQKRHLAYYDTKLGAHSGIKKFCLFKWDFLLTSNYDCLAAKIVTTLRAFTVPGRHLLKDFYLMSNANKVYLPQPLSV